MPPRWRFTPSGSSMVEQGAFARSTGSIPVQVFPLGGAHVFYEQVFGDNYLTFTFINDLRLLDD